MPGCPPVAAAPHPHPEGPGNVFCFILFKWFELNVKQRLNKWERAVQDSSLDSVSAVDEKSKDQMDTDWPRVEQETSAHRGPFNNSLLTDISFCDTLRIPRPSLICIVILSSGWRGG